MPTCPHCGKPLKLLPSDQPLDGASARQLRRIETELARLQAAIEPQPVQVPIQDLKLSTRVENALRRDGVHTLATLLTYRATDLLDIRTLGVNSLGEVQLALHLRRLALRPERDP